MAKLIISLYFSCIISMLHSPVFAGEPGQQKPTGLYSSFYYNQEGGDLIGIEILILIGGSDYYVVFQSSEGVPFVPEIAQASIDGNVLKFSLAEKEFGYSGEFEGIISEQGIIGQFKNGQLSPSGEKKVMLVKGSSYWQQNEEQD